MSANIKTWQERTGNHNVRHGSVKHMIAEIAELRATLAATAPTVAVDDPTFPYGAVSELAAFQYWGSMQDGELTPLRAWQARAKLSAGVAIPEGWALVPVEPTDEMATAAIKVSLRNPAINGVGQYRAMIAAAPSPDQQGE